MSHNHQGGSDNNNMDEDDSAEFVKEYGLSEMFLYDKVLKPSEDLEKVIQGHNVVDGGAVSTIATVVSTEVEAKTETELVVELEGGTGAIDNIGVDQPKEPQPTKQKGQARRRDDEPQEILRKRARASMVHYNAARVGKGKKPMRKEVANKRKNRLRLDIPKFKIKVKQVMSSPSYVGGENSNNNVINNHPDGDYKPVRIPAGESVLDPIGVAPDPEDLEMIENMMFFMNTSPQPFYNPVDANHEYYSLISPYLVGPSHQGQFGRMNSSHVPFVESQPLPPPPMMAFSAEPTPPALSPPLPPTLLGDDQF